MTHVATLELATQQVKKSQEKSHQSWNFHDIIAEILARVATLQNFARAWDAAKEYFSQMNEIKVLLRPKKQFFFSFGFQNYVN